MIFRKSEMYTSQLLPEITPTQNIFGMLNQTLTLKKQVNKVDPLYAKCPPLVPINSHVTIV